MWFHVVTKQPFCKVTGWQHGGFFIWPCGGVSSSDALLSGSCKWCKLFDHNHSMVAGPPCNNVSRRLLSNIFESHNGHQGASTLLVVDHSATWIFPDAIKQALPFAIPYYNNFTVHKHCCACHGGCAIAILYPSLQSTYTHWCFIWENLTFHFFFENS